MAWPMCVHNYSRHVARKRALLLLGFWPPLSDTARTTVNVLFHYVQQRSVHQHTLAAKNLVHPLQRKTLCWPASPNSICFHLRTSSSALVVVRVHHHPQRHRLVSAYSLSRRPRYHSPVPPIDQKLRTTATHFVCGSSPQNKCARQPCATTKDSCCTQHPATLASLFEADMPLCLSLSVFFCSSLQKGKINRKMREGGKGKTN